MRRILSKIIESASEHGISSVVFLLGVDAAFYRSDNAKIYIGTDTSVDNIVSSFFHELGHHYMVLAGIYKKYHTNPTSCSLEYTIKVEREVDKMARDLMRSDPRFRNLRYRPSIYSRRDIRSYLRGYDQAVKDLTSKERVEAWSEVVRD